MRMLITRRATDPSRRARRVPTLLSIAGMLMLLATSLATGASAASPHQVDPAGMVPPLNPRYDPWVCTDTGAGPICRAAVADSWANEDTGMACGNQPIYATGQHSENATRWHLPDGRATRTLFNSSSAETWTLSPTGGGRTISIRGSWNLHYVYGVAGDRSTRVLTITGADWQATAKGYGLVFHDTGLVRFVIGTDDVISITRGPADSDHGNLDLVLAKVCEVLTS